MAREQCVGDVAAVLSQIRTARSAVPPEATTPTAYFYKVLGGTPRPTPVLISIAADTPHSRAGGGYVAITRTLRWINGDWRLQVPDAAGPHRRLGRHLPASGSPRDVSHFDTGCLVTTAANTAVQVMGTEAGQGRGQQYRRSHDVLGRHASIDPASPAVRPCRATPCRSPRLILVARCMVQSIRMMLSRKKDPLIAIAVGLVRYAVATAVGLALLDRGAAGRRRAVAPALVDQGLADYAERMQGLLPRRSQSNAVRGAAAGGGGLGARVRCSGCSRSSGRPGSLVLAAMLCLAAAGSINESTKGWLTKLTSWLAALVAYKPMAAMIYMIGFTLMGAGQDFATLLTGRDGAGARRAGDAGDDAVLLLVRRWRPAAGWVSAARWPPGWRSAPRSGAGSATRGRLGGAGRAAADGQRAGVDHGRAAGPTPAAGPPPAVADPSVPRSPTPAGQPRARWVRPPPRDTRPPGRPGRHPGRGEHRDRRWSYR